jgi:endoglucanase
MACGGISASMGVPDTDPRRLALLDDFLYALDEEGFDGTYWAAGEWWGDYPLSVQPGSDFDADRPQMAVLERYLGDAFEQTASGD